MGPTLPHLLVENAEKLGSEKAALREKEFGIWQSYSWADYLQNVQELALGFLSMGIKRGEKIAILGDNRPQWLFTELAAQSIGCPSVGIFPDSHIDQVKFILNHSDATFLVVEDQEQTDKFLEIREDCPNIKIVIVDDMKGMRQYDDPLLISFETIQNRGKELSSRQPGLFHESINRQSEDTVALIAYTSGTTGVPKGAMLTHRNMIQMAASFDQIDPAFPTDNQVSFLPLPWVGEQMTAVSWHLLKGFTVNFPEKPETVAENIREIGPNILFAPPRFWEKMCSETQVKIQDAVWIKRLFYRLCMPVGYRVAEIRLTKREPNLFLRLLDYVCYLLVFRSLKNYLGLGSLRNVYTGGAALGPEIFNMFQALGVNIKQIYGQTETSGIAVSHRNGDIKLSTVGKPIPGMEISISDSGEILIKGPTVFDGYYRNEEATSKALSDGWLKTGDQGMIDEEGHLVMIDRMKDVMRLTDGTKFSPQLIENKLKFSMYISEAVVVGQDRPYVAAMINMDMGNVGKWAENRKITYTTYTDLSQKMEVYDLIALEIRAINQSLPKLAQIRKFVMLHKELDADDDEMTRTRKIRRSFVEQRYERLVSGLYEVEGPLELASEIKYRDGKEFRMQTTVNIKVVPDIADQRG